MKLSKDDRSYYFDASIIWIYLEIRYTWLPCYNGYHVNGRRHEACIMCKRQKGLGYNNIYGPSSTYHAPSMYVLPFVLL